MSEDYKKWKGTYRLNVPSPKSSSNDDMKKYNRALGFFKSQIEAIEKSNNIKIDCESDWDINILKNRKVGAVFNRKEYDFDGKNGFYTQCYKLKDVQSIRDGKYNIPNDTLLKRDDDISNNSTTIGDLDDFEVVISDGEVPF